MFPERHRELFTNSKTKQCPTVLLLWTSSYLKTNTASYTPSSGLYLIFSHLLSVTVVIGPPDLAWCPFPSNFLLLLSGGQRQQLLLSEVGDSPPQYWPVSFQQQQHFQSVPTPLSLQLSPLVCSSIQNIQCKRFFIILFFNHFTQD